MNVRLEPDTSQNEAYSFAKAVTFQHPMMTYFSVQCVMISMVVKNVHSREGPSFVFAAMRVFATIVRTTNLVSLVWNLFAKTANRKVISLHVTSARKRSVMPMTFFTATFVRKGTAWNVGKALGGTVASNGSAIIVALPKCVKSAEKHFVIAICVHHSGSRVVDANYSFVHDTI